MQANYDNPCPVCGKADWCFRVNTNVWTCGRPPQPGHDKRWHQVAVAKDGRSIYSLNKTSWGQARERGFKDFEPLELDPNQPDWQVAAVRHVLEHELSKDAEDQPRQLQDYLKLRDLLGERLRFNELSKTVELDGKPWEISDAKLSIAIDFAIKTKCGDEAITRICDRIARENSYSPVRDYLSAVYERHGGGYPLDRLALQYLGTDNPLHGRLLMQTLIAAVARAYRPGCKADTLTILVGP